MRLHAPARRIVLLALAVLCVVWTVGMPVLGQVLYPTPEQQPHGAARVAFYCHLL